MAASDKDLGELHKLVAQSLSDDLTAAKSIEDPALRAATIDKARAQAIAFLKNNSITADIETNAELGALKETLAAKRQGRPRAALEDALAQFNQMNPGLPS
jgi:hypothetical protein